MKKGVFEELEKYLLKEVFYAKFTPVEKIVYGLVGIILTGVILAALNMIFIK